MRQNDPRENRLRHFNRRSFLQACGALFGGAIACEKVSPLLSRAFAGTGETQNTLRGKRSPRRLIYIAIDALHPKYLELNSMGRPGGKDGDWLMPSIRSFLDRAVWYPEAKAYLPAATDMNHLNALAGASMAQNGIIGVWAQPVGWDEKGKAVLWTRSSTPGSGAGPGLRRFSLQARVGWARCSASLHPNPASTFS